MSYNICITVWQYLYHSPQSWTLYHSLTICWHLTSPSKPQITTFSFCSKYLETRPSLSHAEHSNKTRQIDSDIVISYLKKVCLKYKDKILSNVLGIQGFFRIQFTESENVYSFHPGHTKKGGWVGLDYRLWINDPRLGMQFTVYRSRYQDCGKSQRYPTVGLAKSDWVATFSL